MILLAKWRLTRRGERGVGWMGGPLWSPAYLVPEFATNINVSKNRFLAETRQVIWTNDSIGVCSLFALMVSHGFLCVVRSLLALVRLFCELFPKTPDSLGF